MNLRDLLSIVENSLVTSCQERGAGPRLCLELTIRFARGIVEADAHTIVTPALALDLSSGEGLR